MKASALNFRALSLRFSLFFLAIATAAVPTAWGQSTLLWDNASGSGAWNYTSSNWTDGSSATPFTSGDAGVFTDLGAGTVTIQGSGVLTSGVYVDASAEYTFQGGALTGTGGLEKYGSGKLSLAGANTFTGNTYVGGSSGTGGTLTVANTHALQNSKVYVYGSMLDVRQPGTTLAGLTLATLNGVGSTLELQLNETNKTSAALIVKSGGSFSFDSNSVINADISDFSGLPATYYLLSGAGANTIDTNNVNIYVDAPSRTTLSYQQSSNSLYVTLSRNTYSDLYWEWLSPNGFQVAMTVDRALGMGITTPLFTALDNVSSYGYLTYDALNQLHGEVYVTQFMLSSQLQRDFNNRLMNWRNMIANNDCCRYADNCRGQSRRCFDLWGTVHATSIDRKYIGPYSGFEADTCGVTVGAEWKPSPLWYLGLAFGYDDAGMTYDKLTAKTDMRAARVSLYGGYVNSCWYGSGFLGYSKDWYDTERYIAFPGFAAIAQGRNDDNVFSTGVEFGKFFSWGELNIIPTIGLNYVCVQSPEFTETNAGSANLTMQSATYNSFRMPVGFRTNMDICICNGLVLTPEMRVFGVTEWANRGMRRWGYFADAVDAGPFFADGGGWGRNGMLFGIGLTAQFGCRVTVGFDYDCETWKEYNRHIGSAYISYRW